MQFAKYLHVAVGLTILNAENLDYFYRNTIPDEKYTVAVSKYNMLES